MLYLAGHPAVVEQGTLLGRVLRVATLAGALVVVFAAVSKLLQTCHADRSRHTHVVVAAERGLGALSIGYAMCAG